MVAKKKKFERKEIRNEKVENFKSNKRIFASYVFT